MQLPALERWTTLEQLVLDQCGLLTHLSLSLPRLRTVSLRHCRALANVTLCSTPALLRAPKSAAAMPRCLSACLGVTGMQHHLWMLIISVAVQSGGSEVRLAGALGCGLRWCRPDAARPHARGARGRSLWPCHARCCEDSALGPQPGVQICICHLCHGASALIYVYQYPREHRMQWWLDSLQ